MKLTLTEEHWIIFDMSITEIFLTIKKDNFTDHFNLILYRKEKIQAYVCVSVCVRVSTCLSVCATSKFPVDFRET
jgi:hypothetical protein